MSADRAPGAIPEFQNPGTAEPQQQGLIGVDLGDSPASGGAGPTPAIASQPWPKKLPDQIAAIRDLVTPGTAWSAATTAAAFKSAKVEQVQEVMESLASLGILIQLDGPAGPTWTVPRMSAGL